MTEPTSNPPATEAPLSFPTPSALAHGVADLLQEKKGQELSVLDVSESTTRIADYMILCTGLNARQVAALAEDVVKLAKRAGRIALSVAGTDHNIWVCIDLGDVVVHVMQPEARAHYDLDALWADARVVRRGVEGEDGD